MIRSKLWRQSLISMPCSTSGRGAIGHRGRCWGRRNCSSFLPSSKDDTREEQVVDLSDFLLNRCDWREAPKCPDYVGPVEVRLTPDGRGRGLFASQTVSAGSLLLISNPLAISYNDPYAAVLLSKLVQIARKNTSSLRRLYALASTPRQDHLPPPSMELLTATTDQLSGVCAPPVDPLDVKRIHNIMRLNFFSGEMITSPYTQFSGLWLIPSLINHSCIRNASRVMAGEAMVIYAARDIQAGEEITISYVDLLKPLRNREESYQGRTFPFSCVCKRCVLERSLQHHLKDLCDRFYALHGKAAKEVNSAMCAYDPLPLDSFPACMELAGVFDTVKSTLSSSAGISKIEQGWILTGYSSAFLGKWLVTGWSTVFEDPSLLVNASAIELLEAMRSAVPGLYSTLSFTTLLASLSCKIDGKRDMASKLLDMARDECLRVYGKQRRDVVEKLMERLCELIPFS